MHSELITSQQNLLLTEQNSLLGAICTSKSFAFFFPLHNFFRVTLLELPRIKKTGATACENKNILSAVYAININMMGLYQERWSCSSPDVEHCRANKTMSSDVDKTIKGREEEEVFRGYPLLSRSSPQTHPVRPSGNYLTAVFCLTCEPWESLEWE